MENVRSITNTRELRTFLVEQMNKAANGEVDIGIAKAVTNYAQQIYNTLNIELKAAAMADKIPEGGVKPVPFNG